MTDTQQPDLVFVCGPSHRCGSTLIQRALNVHPEVLIYGEDNNILKFGRSLYEHACASAEHKHQDEDFMKDPSGWQANIGACPELYTKAYGIFLSQVLLTPSRAEQVGRDIHTQQYTGCKSLFNTPAEFRFIKLLLPSSKIIFCVRPFKDCVRSYMRQEWGMIPPEQYFTLWAKSMAALDESSEHIDLVINYQNEFDAEELTEQLQGILPRVTLDVEAIRKVTKTRLVFDETKPIKTTKLPIWTQYA